MKDKNKKRLNEEVEPVESTDPEETEEEQEAREAEELRREELEERRRVARGEAAARLKELEERGCCTLRVRYHNNGDTTFGSDGKRRKITPHLDGGVVPGYMIEDFNTDGVIVNKWFCPASNVELRQLYGTPEIR